MGAVERTRRITLSEIVEALLARRSGDHSSVTLSRNAKGETQIEVSVRTGDSEDVQTAEQAFEKAAELYDRARRRYPMSSGFTGPAPAESAPPQTP